VATGLSPAPLPRDVDENISVVAIPFAELVAQVSRGELRDAKTVAAVLLVACDRGTGCS
jgi:hypothetical protein